MEGWLPIVFLGVVLKIPVGFALWIIWWAWRQEPEIEESPGDEHGFRRWRREPIRPRDPRRGPHGGAVRALPGCPGGRRRMAPRPATVATARREPAESV